ncbi:pyridoxamine 5'-phosphate oxidase family protein [Paenibacillus faecalis]|uniref:pyridoxamine 5'-phosphate oxidase family protein n=1 Tax=Paenibacillus faecalis TaxID=2079532 RepID=UPI000D11426E|nr:pyridoxamine 5'-phosphate oxidase family protein [Paenibacillus faecalis]
MRRSEFMMDNPEEVEQFLAEMSFGFLGTVDEAGCPRVTPLNFVFVEGAYYFHGCPYSRTDMQVPSHPFKSAKSLTFFRDALMVK